MFLWPEWLIQGWYFVEKFDAMAVSPSGQKAPVRVYSMTKKIPISLVLVLVLWYLRCYFYTLIITFITFFYYLIIAQCIRQVKEYESVWNEVKLLAHMIIIFLRCFPFWQTVFEHLAGLLGVLITLDEIMDASHTLKEHWKQYRR